MTKDWPVNPAFLSPAQDKYGDVSPFASSGESGSRNKHAEPRFSGQPGGDARDPEPTNEPGRMSPVAPLHPIRSMAELLSACAGRGREKPGSSCSKPSRQSLLRPPNRRRRALVFDTKWGGAKAVKARARALACLFYRLLTKGQTEVRRNSNSLSSSARSETLACNSCPRPRERNHPRRQCRRKTFLGTAPGLRPGPARSGKANGSDASALATLRQRQPGYKRLRQQISLLSI